MALLTVKGLVENVSGQVLTARFMQKRAKRFWWPDVDDRQTVEANRILCRLKTVPSQVSSQHFIIEDSTYIDELCSRILSD